MLLLGVLRVLRVLGILRVLRLQLRLRLRLLETSRIGLRGTWIRWRNLLLESLLPCICRITSTSSSHTGRRETSTTIWLTMTGLVGELSWPLALEHGVRALKTAVWLRLTLLPRMSRRMLRALLALSVCKVGRVLRAARRRSTRRRAVKIFRALIAAETTKDLFGTVHFLFRSSLAYA